MKVRSGFVSNSSTSSYILIVPIDLHEKLTETMGDYEKRVIGYIAEVDTILGQECMVLSWFSGNVDTFDYADLGERLDDADSPYTVLNKYEVQAKKDSRTWFHSDDM